MFDSNESNITATTMLKSHMYKKILCLTFISFVLCVFSIHARAIDDIELKVKPSIEELSSLYDIQLNTTGIPQSISCKSSDMPSLDEIKTIFGDTIKISNQEAADTRLKKYLAQHYGLSEEQLQKGIEAHNGVREFAQQLSSFDITKQAYKINEETEANIIDLIVSGFSNSESITAIVLSETMNIDLSHFKDTLLDNKNENEAKNPSNFINLFEQNESSSSNFDRTYKEKQDELFVKRQTLYGLTATEKTTKDQGFAPEESIGKPYSYMNNGNISVTENTGDYTYTENDLTIPGINGLDLKIERQFSSSMSNLEIPYGNFSDEADGSVYVVYSTVYEISNYDVENSEFELFEQPDYAGPYVASYYTFDEDVEIFPYTWFSAGEYETAAMIKSSMETVFTLATNQDGEEVFVAVVPFISGVSPNFETTCENRTHNYSYTLSTWNLGNGWRFNFPAIEKYRARQFSGDFDISVDDESTKRRLILPDGSKYEIDFDCENKSNLVGYPLEDMQVDLSDYPGAKYQLEFQNGTTYQFDSSGRMIAQEDAYGNEITVEYNNEGFVITDTLKNKIEFIEVPVSGDQYYNGTTGEEWIYNIQNKLRLNGKTIRTYYSYDDGDAVYLQLVKNEADEITRYSCSTSTMEFNSFVNPSQKYTNDSELQTVRIREIYYPDQSSISLGMNRNERRIGLEGFSEYYALDFIEKYDKNLDEYPLYTEYTYGDFDGVYFWNSGGYKTVIKNFYKFVMNGQEEEVPKNTSVVAFDADHTKYSNSLYLFKSVQYDTFENNDEVDDWNRKPTYYLAQEDIYFYNSDYLVDENITRKYTKNLDQDYSTIQEFDYNKYGQVTREKKPDGTTIYYDYDSTYGLQTSIQIQQNDDTEIVLTNTLVDGDRKIGETTVSSNGNLQKKEGYVYDQYGNLICEKYYVDDNTYNEKQYVYQNNAWRTESKVVNVKDANDVLVPGSPGYDAGVLTEKISYNDRGWPITQTDANGNTTVTNYDAVGRITSVLYPNGSKDSYDYNITKNVVTYTNALGHIIENTYDSLGNLRRVYDISEDAPLKDILYYCGNLVQTTTYGTESPTQKQYYHYDALDREIENGIIASDNSGTLSEERTVYRGHENSVEKTIYGYDEVPDQEETYYYDEAQNLVSIEHISDDGSTVKNRYTYDNLGYAVKENINFSKEGGAASDINYVRDAFGNIISQTDGLNQTTQNKYDLSGNLLATTDPRGNTTTYVYDAAGRLLKTMQPFTMKDGKIYYASTINEYDSNGNLIKQVVDSSIPGDAEKNYTIEYEYDSKNNLITVKMGTTEPNYTQYQYDAVGNIIAVYTGNKSKLSFDSSGKPLGDGDYAVTTYEYDGLSHLTQTTDALGQKESYQYDTNNLLLEKTDRNGNTTNYVYNSQWNPLTITVTSSEGEKTDQLDYSYFKNGLLSSERNENYSRQYLYDAFGRVIEEDMDDISIIRKFSEEGNQIARYIYRGMEEISSAQYDYDKNGQMESFTDKGVSIKYDYDKNGNQISIDYGNGILTTYAYNLANLPISVTHTKDSNILAQFSGDYSLDGNIVQISSNTGSVTKYTYDELNRLVKESQKNGETEQTYSYTFDSFNNRHSLSASGANTYQIEYEYDKNNRLLKAVKKAGENVETTKYFYDPNGNQISANTETLMPTSAEMSQSISMKMDNATLNQYNGFNQLIASKVNGVNAEYSYTATGLRKSKTIDGTTEEYLLDNGNVVGILNDGAIDTYYAYGNELVSAISNNSPTFYLNNIHGDVSCIVDPSGTEISTYQYDAYGVVNEAAASDTNPFRYCGEFYDFETGNIYLRARYYNPVLGIFTQQDTNQGNFTDPLSLNYYIYCKANPVLYIDSTGYQPEFMAKLMKTFKAMPLYKEFVSKTQKSQLDSFYSTFGFYDPDNNGIYHVRQKNFQSWAGYNDFYDAVFDFGSSMDYRKVIFKANNEDFVLWFWKGDYLNLGAGAEVGIYYGGGPHWFAGTQYALPMTLSVKTSKGEVISNWNPSEPQWWITSFNSWSQNRKAEDIAVSGSINFSKRLSFWASFVASAQGIENMTWSFDYNNHIAYFKW